MKSTGSRLIYITTRKLWKLSQPSCSRVMMRSTDPILQFFGSGRRQCHTLRPVQRAIAHTLTPRSIISANDAIPQLNTSSMRNSSTAAVALQQLLVLSRWSSARCHGVNQYHRPVILPVRATSNNGVNHLAVPITRGWSRQFKSATSTTTAAAAVASPSARSGSGWMDRQPEYRLCTSRSSSSTPTPSTTRLHIDQQGTTVSATTVAVVVAPSSLSTVLNRSEPKLTVRTSPQQQQRSLPPLELSRLYRYLHLVTFQRSELEHVFDRISLIDTTHEESETVATLDQTVLAQYLVRRFAELEAEHPSNLYHQHHETPSVGSDDDSAATTMELKRSTEQQRLMFAKEEAARIIELLAPNEGQRYDDSCIATCIHKADFCDRITSLASTVDARRSAPVFVSMLLVGASVGVINPAMPFVVQALALTASQYGAVVAAFGLSKMLGNVPAAIAVERHGRKPYMTYSLALIAVGVGGIGFAGSFEELYACRLMTGLGVAALSTAGTLMITDISTPLNRASTYAPIMSAFAAGTALGPALGGLLVDQLGLQMTFYAVGVSYLWVAVVNRFILSETKNQPIEFPWQIQQRKNNSAVASNKEPHQTESIASALQSAVGQWGPMLKDPACQSVIVMNGVYWIALAGSQMTLLPLMLTADVASGGLAFTATQVGQVYMGMSLVQIFGNPIFAKLSDTIGKVPVIIGATTLIGLSMYSLPLCCGTVGQQSLLPLAATLGLWSTGSSMLSTAPLAYVSDRVDESKRAQAIALLRTSGDVGFLIGAAGTGALADWTGSLDVAMQTSAGLLLTATVWFAMRQALTVRLLEATTASTESAGSSKSKTRQM